MGLCRVSPKVSVVIVTYHNTLMLRGLLRGLLNQSLPCHEIIVFDNSADPETRTMVSKEFREVRLLSAGENIGTAGGFHVGMLYAINKCDFVLTLDDDVEVLSTSIEGLYRSFQELTRQGIAVGAVRAVGRFDKAKTYYPIEWFPWRGTFILTAAIKKAGLPRRDYFMYAEDTEFSLRMSQQGYLFFCTPHSRITEIRKSGKSHNQVFGKKFFYYADDFRSYYAARNFIHVWKRFNNYRELLRTIIYCMKLSLFTMLFTQNRSCRRARALLQGVIDGFRGRLGRNDGYLPGVTP
jgi:GT2 family glycosyltransferase